MYIYVRRPSSYWAVYAFAFFIAHHFIFIFPKSQQPEVAVLVLQDADLQAI